MKNYSLLLFFGMVVFSPHTYACEEEILCNLGPNYIASKSMSLDQKDSVADEDVNEEKIHKDIELCSDEKIGELIEVGCIRYFPRVVPEGVEPFSFEDAFSNF